MEPNIQSMLADLLKECGEVNITVRAAQPVKEDEPPFVTMSADQYRGMVQLINDLKEEIEAANITKSNLKEENVKLTSRALAAERNSEAKSKIIEAVTEGGAKAPKTYTSIGQVRIDKPTILTLIGHIYRAEGLSGLTAANKELGECYLHQL